MGDMFGSEIVQGHFGNHSMDDADAGGIFAQRLRMAVGNDPRTQIELGAAMGLHRAQLGRLMTGARPDPNMIPKLADVLRVKLDWLLGLSDEMTASDLRWEDLIGSLKNDGRLREFVEMVRSMSLQDRAEMMAFAEFRSARPLPYRKPESMAAEGGETYGKKTG